MDFIQILVQTSRFRQNNPRIRFKNNENTILSIFLKSTKIRFFSNNWQTFYNGTRQAISTIVPEHITEERKKPFVHGTFHYTVSEIDSDIPFAL
jgi:hypothetical protein